MDENSEQEMFDVVVVGGGAAGLAGALTLARSRRTVLVVDGGEPRNARADAVHNYLGREGTPPLDLVAAGRAEVEAYGAQVRAGRVVSAAARDGGFALGLADGSSVDARRLLLATGARDRLPAVPGLAERWGRDVLHCPYCHGWEVRDRAVAVLATTAMAAHSALLFRQLTDDVVVLDGDGLVSEADRARLERRGVRVVAERTSEVVVEDDRLSGVRLVGGEVLACDALVVASYVDARSELLDQLGVEVQPVLIGDEEVATAVVADPTGRTSVPGVWAAGNLTAPMSQVIASAAAGTMAGAMVNMDLVQEEAS